MHKPGLRLDGVYIESFVHASTAIWLGFLKSVSPENQMTDAGEIMQATFEVVPPDPGNDDIFRPTIKKFLDETSLDLLTVDKQKRESYREEELSKTWFGCGTIRYPTFEQVAEVRSANVAHRRHRQEATLNSTSVKTVAFAAPAHESATANIMQVEVLLHSSGVSFDSAKASHTCAIPPSKSYSRRPRWTRQRAPHWPVKGRASTCPTPAETRPKRLGLAGRKQGWPSTPPKPPEGMPWRRGALSALPMPPLPHALAQISAQRKQAGAASPAPAAGEPLALQRLRRVVSTREPDPRPPPRWIPWRRQLHRHLCARVGSF